MADIEDLIQWLHKEYILSLNNPNAKTQNEDIIIKIKKENVLNFIDEELNQTYSNVRFTLNNEEKTLLRHNLYYDFYYIKIPYFNNSTEIILHILPKSYSYLNDDSIFIFKADIENDIEIENTPEYQITKEDGSLKIEFLQKEITESGEIISPRKIENRNIKQEDPDDYWIRDEEYNNEYITDIERIPREQNTINIETSEDFILNIGKLQLLQNNNRYESKVFDFSFNFEKEDGVLKYPIEINSDNQSNDLILFINSNTSFIINQSLNKELLLDSLIENKEFQIIYNGNNYNNLSNSIINFKQVIPQSLDIVAKTEFKLNLVNNDSYIILTNGDRIKFGLENTPISNFCNNNANTGNIIIGDEIIIKNTIKEIVFGESYNEVNVIGNYFLNSCTSLTTVDFNNLINVTTLGESFVSNCSSLMSLNLVFLENTTNIGKGFLEDNNNLREIYISNTSWFNKSIITTNLMNNILNTNDCTLYSETIELAYDFKLKMNNAINNWNIITNVSYDSYLTLTNERVLSFSMEDTPISIFCTSGTSSSLVTIKETSFQKKEVKEIVFGESYNGVTSVTRFLYYYTNLITADLTNLSNITNMGDYSFMNCSSLTDSELLKPLVNLTEVGISFFNSCSELTSLNTESLTNLTSIGRAFLSGCKGLTSLDFSFLRNVQYIPDSFLSNATSLTTIYIGDVDWSLKNIDIGLGDLIFYSIPNSSDCRLYSTTEELCEIFKSKFIKYGRTESRISEWLSVGVDSYIELKDSSRIDFGAAEVPIDNFCNSSTLVVIKNESYTKSSIAKIKFGESYKSVKTIPKYFLYNFRSLTAISLIGFTNVTSTENYFIYGCTNLTTLKLSYLTRLQSIGESSISNLTNMTTLDLRDLNILRTIGNGFLSNATKLSKIYIGSVNWDTKTINNTWRIYTGVENVSTNQISASSPTRANSFKTAMGGVISEWTWVMG